MNSKSIYFYLLILLLIISCSKKEKVQVLKEKSLESLMIETYNESMEEFYNGDVISMVSSPSFNPNAFVHGIDKKYWQELINYEKKPHNNK